MSHLNIVTILMHRAPLLLMADADDFIHDGYATLSYYFFFFATPPYYAFLFAISFSPFRHDIRHFMPASATLPSLASDAAAYLPRCYAIHASYAAFFCFS